MASASSLTQAAGQTFNNLFAKWTAGTLKTNLVAFSGPAVLAEFPEQAPTNHPISNWLVLISSLAFNMESGNSFLFVPYEQVVTATTYVYRICWMGEKLNTQTSISGAQAAALLAAYNAAF